MTSANVLADRELPDLTGSTVVMKFGGTSVGDLGRIRKVAEIVAKTRRGLGNAHTVVVVSAMAGETNRLLSLAKTLSPQPDPRECDVLLATGEQVSIALVALALRNIGIAAQSFTAAQAGISTDGLHTSAHIQTIRSEAVQAALERGVIPVVAGFQGMNSDGDITTLGRGGSDITAVALAAALDAALCLIFTDVPGVLSGDPRSVPGARLHRVVAHSEMLELASLGAKVLHPRSVYFAQMYRVPMIVLSTLAGDLELGKNGTLVKTYTLEERMSGMEDPAVTGVASRIDEGRITIDHVPLMGTALVDIFSRLATDRISTDMISQTTASDGNVTLSFTVGDDVSDRALELVREILPRVGARGASIDRNIAKVSVVGVGMQYHADVPARIFRALAQHNVEVHTISSSEIRLSLLVTRKYAEVAVRAVHREFFGDAAL
jgi:aspartate kinase